MQAAPLPALLELPEPVQSQDADGGGVRGGGAFAALAPRLAGLEVGAELQDLSADGQRRLRGVRRAGEYAVGPVEGHGRTPDCEPVGAAACLCRLT